MRQCALLVIKGQGHQLQVHVRCKVLAFAVCSVVFRQPLQMFLKTYLAGALLSMQAWSLFLGRPSKPHNTRTTISLLGDENLNGRAYENTQASCVEDQILHPEWSTLTARVDAASCVDALGRVQRAAGPNVDKTQTFFAKKRFPSGPPARDAIALPVGATSGKAPFMYLRCSALLWKRNCLERPVWCRRMNGKK